MSIATTDSITELAILPLVADSDPTSPSSSTSSIFHNAHNTVAAQPGFLRLSWGMHLEDPSRTTWFIDWTSVSAHEAFMASPAYKPFLDSIRPILAGAANITHYDFGGSGGGGDPPSKSLAAPVTEFATFYLQLGTATTDFASRVRDAMGEFRAHATGYVGASWGFSHEEVEHESLGGEKGRACVLVLGWDSVDAHTAFRGTEVFKRAMGPVREMFKGSQMYHCQMRPH